MKEVKRLVTLVFNLEVNQYFSRLLEKMDNPTSEARNKINGFSNETHCTSIEYSIETLMKEYKPVDREKSGFDNQRDES